jgi:DNA polymerase III sliding clamp (beta) subunit (PCNA family)
VKLEEVSTDGKSHLALSSGRTKAKFNLMQVDHYPAWSAFDPSDLISAENLGGKIALVEWAAAKSDATTQLEGVHFDGERCVATDRYRLASTDLAIPDLPAAVTVPAGILSQILKQTGEVRLGVDTQQLLMMPDDSTQIRAILYGGEYPKVERIMNREHPDRLKVRKSQLLEVMTRASNFAGADRFPSLKMFFGREEIAVMMNNEEIGLLGDVVDVPGYATHGRVQIIFTPKNIIDAVTFCPNEDIEIGYDHENPEKIMYLKGGSGYEAWIVPRTANDPKPE